MGVWLPWTPMSEQSLLHGNERDRVFCGRSWSGLQHEGKLAEILSRTWRWYYKVCSLWLSEGILQNIFGSKGDKNLIYLEYFQTYILCVFMLTWLPCKPHWNKLTILLIKIWKSKSKLTCTRFLVDSYLSLNLSGFTTCMEGLT